MLDNFYSLYQLKEQEQSIKQFRAKKEVIRRTPIWKHGFKEAVKAVMSFKREPKTVCCSAN